MMKQIEIHGQRVELYSPDKGRTWSSSSQSIVAYRRRKKTLLSELQKSFEQVDEIQDADPDQVTEMRFQKA